MKIIYKKGETLFQIHKHDTAQRGKEFPKATQQDCVRSRRQFIHASTNKHFLLILTFLRKHTHTLEIWGFDTGVSLATEVAPTPYKSKFQP